MFAALPGGFPGSDPAQVSWRLLGLLGLYGLLIFAGVAVNLFVFVRALARPLVWEQRCRRLVARSWSWNDLRWVVLGLLLLLLLMLGVAWMLDLAGFVPEAESDAGISILDSVAFHLAALLILCLIMRQRGWSWSAAFGLRAHGFLRRLGQGLVLYAGVLPSFFLAALLSHLLMWFYGCPATMQDVVLFFLEQQSPAVNLLLLGMAVVVAPVSEELFFRGVLLPALVRRMGLGAGVFLSSALFAAIHLHLPSFLPLLTLASGFALAYVYTGSLWVPICMHSLFNGLNIALLMSVDL